MEKFESKFSALTPEGEAKEQEAEKKQEELKAAYIEEKEDSVSYLGVEVPKGEGGPLVPDRQEFANYFYTEEDYILRREIATSLVLNKPLLLEGGTGIGKTSAVASMCAELNTNYCKVSFGRDMAIEDVIGGKTITTDEKGGETVKWYDGNLMVAIRHGGIALLDEYNLQGSKIGSRVNPVIDAILNGRKTISLPENDNEEIEVHPNFRIIAAQNPPGTEEGQEFTGREVLSAETFGRYTFHKMPLQMNKEMRNKRMAGMMGEEVDVDIPKEEFKYLGEGIPLKELKDIPGMTHWRREAIDIIDMLTAKSMGAKREMARDQRQKLYFNPRLEQGLLHYVGKFYRGDVNEVWQNAFEHLVVGMYKSEDDKQKVREALNQASFIPQTESKRKGVEREAEQEKELSPETELTSESVELKEVREIFKEDFLGINEAENFTGAKLTEKEKKVALAKWQEKIKEQNITKEDLERLKKEGFMVVYRSDKILLGEEEKPITVNTLRNKFSELFYRKPGEGWYDDEKFAKEGKIESGWSIVKKEILDESKSKDWNEQEKVLKKWAKEHNVDEKFVRRRTPEEITYDILNYYKTHDKRILENDWDWTAVQSSAGSPVTVGNFASDGLHVAWSSRGRSSSHFSVCPSR